MPDLILLHDSGTSDMGSLDFLIGTDVNRVARWPVEEPGLSISSLRVHFATVPGEGGTGVADLQIWVDSQRGTAFDHLLWTIPDVGIGADINFRVPVNQEKHFYVEQGDSPVLIWASPDDGKIEWGATLAMVRSTRTDAPR